ncbi:hypothetical protein [Bradyrhizobium sp. B117]|uniref:hypothetical protein n=1 Tax=Bradyrhizobium sp. B117 TaxID=3140246 RepID=UPI0031837894
MERICLDLAATSPEERAGLAIMTGNYRAAILDRRNRSADTEPFLSAGVSA